MHILQPYAYAEGTVTVLLASQGRAGQENPSSSKRASKQAWKERREKRMWTEARKMGFGILRSEWMDGWRGWIERDRGGELCVLYCMVR